MKTTDSPPETLGDATVVRRGGRFRRGFAFVKVGLCSYRLGHQRLSRRELDELLKPQYSRPVRLCRLGQSTYWMYRDKFLVDRLGRTSREVAAAVETGRELSSDRVPDASRGAAATRREVR